MCRAEWFPAPHSARIEVLSNVERALGLLARIENIDDEELLEFERLLGRIREVLLGSRWL